ncbi:MAG: hypothetical protein SGPRY_000692 [Prymnesium sp.]
MRGVLVQCNHSEDHVKDHCNLEVLNAATLVENSRQRFAVDKMYTYISEILIAVNPFKFIEGLYSDEMKQKYKGNNWTTLEPHVYAAAEMAFKHMELQAMSQSLLVSGESGAGKTETNKQLMEYLIWRTGVDKNRSVDSNLAQQILDTNPVLESFGNAKNSRNKNSSRFGKYVNLKFNRELQVMGAEIRTFLLEKSRVTSATLPGERSYHIFYQLVATANAKNQLPCLAGKRAQDFVYSSQSGTTQIVDVDDAEVFDGVDKGLKSCGFSDDDRKSLYEVVAALLYIGNVRMVANDDAVTVTKDSHTFLKTAEQLLGVGDLTNLFVERVVHSPRSKSEYHISLDITSANGQRDALVKHIYTMIFNLLIARINTIIETDRDFHKFIGLLDVFGFEVFLTNSFEQLCINYANERLHNFFLMRVFEVEIQLYRMQNLQVPVLTYPDNSKVIELLEKSPTGIFPLLDAQCKMPKGSDKGFCTAVQKQHAKHPNFLTLAASSLKVKTTTDDNSFVICHFAGDVCYTCTDFLAKNTDQLSAQFETELKRSQLPFVVTMVNLHMGKPAPFIGADGREMGLRRPSLTSAGGGGGMLSSRGGMMSSRNSASKGGQMSARGGPKGPTPQSGSVGKKFLVSLKQLMREIATTHPYFIRCIKPNSSLKPAEFVTSMVLGQLEKSGTIECVKLMQDGYPSRAPYEDLTNRFSGALPDFMMSMDSQDFVQLLLLACNCKHGDYQLGQDMVFFRANRGGVLQELMMMRKDEVAGRIVANANAMELTKTDPQLATYLSKLEEYVKMRKEQRKKARADFRSSMVATIGLLRWIEWGEKQALIDERAATKLQAIQRGRFGRQYLKKTKEAEEAAAQAAAEAERLSSAGEDGAAAEAMKRSKEEAAKADAVRAAVHANAEALNARRGSKTQPPDLPMEEEVVEEAHEKWFKTVSGVEHHRFLMCKGVEWGFQYHNFYGDWELAENEPICHGRPHYVHNTMYGGYAHLFHTMDPHYNVPRWVIGPAPGNENGWAFCESDAPTPHEAKTTWISWDGFEWHSCKTFRFVAKEHELDGLSDEEDFLDDEEEVEVAPQPENSSSTRRKVFKMSAKEYEEQLTARQTSVMQKSKSKASGDAASSPANATSPVEEEKKTEKKKKKGGLFKKRTKA